MIRLSLVFALLAFSQAGLAESGANKPESVEARYSYAAGHIMMSRLGIAAEDLDEAGFVQSVRDFFAGADPALSQAEMQEALTVFQKRQAEKAEKASRENLMKGQAWLKENGAKDGVKTTPSGLQYRVLEAGTGAKPTAQSTVVVHYRGTLIDGTEFDSSYSRGQPASFKVGGVIKGWQEGLQLMSQGSKWQLFVPADLGYGARGQGGTIGPNEVLVFDVELLEVK